MHKTKRVAVVFALMTSACAMRAAKKAPTQAPLVEAGTALEPTQRVRIVESNSNKEEPVEKKKERSIDMMLADLKENRKSYEVAYEIGDFDLNSLEFDKRQAIAKAVLGAMKLDSDVVAPGVRILGKIGDVVMVYEIAKYANDNDSNVRFEVAKALGNYRIMPSVYPLIDLMADRRLMVEREAVYSLAKIGLPAAGALTDVIRNGNPDLQYAAVEALSRMGHDAIDHTLRLLSSPDSKVVYHAVTVLGNLPHKIGHVNYANELIPLLHHPEGNIRGTTANALRKIGDDVAIGPLKKVAKDDENPFVRAAANGALKAFGQ